MGAVDGDLVGNLPLDPADLAGRLHDLELEVAVGLCFRMEEGSVEIDTTAVVFAQLGNLEGAVLPVLGLILLLVAWIWHATQLGDRLVEG